MKVAAILSTYNNPAWLEKTLWGYMRQSRPADELIIADDGSGPETADLIARYAQVLPIRHVWQEDAGFRKSAILNRAIEQCQSDYCIFSDQDCIPRRDFVARHVIWSQKGRYLSAGCFRLPSEISEAITEEMVETGDCFRIRFLCSLGLSRFSFHSKLWRNDTLCNLMNIFTTTRPTFNGCNSSAWREDLLRVNGFDERIGYGGQDRELGYRLRNTGVRPRLIRYYAVCLHLHHEHPYKTKETLAANKVLIDETLNTKSAHTQYGIVRQ